MPIYEYICPECRNQFELWQYLCETNSTALCPKCYADAEKLISSFACKTGGNLQPAEKRFGKAVYSVGKARARDSKRKKRNLSS